MNQLCCLADIGMAYRKAKADLFYSTRSCRDELNVFESNIKENLEEIHKSINPGKFPCSPKDSWTLVPKEIEPDKPKTTPPISSDSKIRWEAIRESAEEDKKSAEEDKKKVKARFRLMENLPVEFHVFSTLWINKVGHKFEEMLSESARGNRLRRGKRKNINLLSLGSTVPYLHPYRKWRDDGFLAIETALAHNKAIAMLHTDINSFYHKIDVNFMLNEKFIEQCEIELTENEKTLNELFINALSAWAEATPIKRGLPVGLAASSIIANVSLLELDRLIEHEVVPLYYGRYVDDIILILENTQDFKSTSAVWDWLMKRIDSLKWKDGKAGEICWEPDYLKGSEILFKEEKSELFLLQGNRGKAMLKNLRYEVNTRSSEWRSLPDLPDDPGQLESVFLSVIANETDTVSIRRGMFALKLRDIEAYARLLAPANWEEQRHAFFASFIQSVLVLPDFFYYFDYLQRVISLATHCADFKHLKEMLDALDIILSQLRNECELCIKAEPCIKVAPEATPEATPEDGDKSEEYHSVFRDNLIQVIKDNVTSSFPLELSKKSKHEWEDTLAKSTLLELGEINEIQRKHRCLLLRDLAYKPLKQYFLPPEFSGSGRHPISRKFLSSIEMPFPESDPPIDNRIVSGCKIITELAKLPIPKNLPPGLLFPVRPMGIHDLYLLHQDPFSEQGRKEIEHALLSIRGFKPENLPVRGNKRHDPIDIGYERSTDNVRQVALVNWKTDIQIWRSSVTQKIILDKNKLDRLNALLNQVLHCKKTPNYLIFPELSIPAHWFLAITKKLQSKGISLICGIEYLHKKRKIVHNQVWVSLLHDAVGFPTSMIYRQDKQRPALHEEQELKDVGGKIMRPQFKSWRVPPIIKHGDFRFAVLVCSELTNIAYRAYLRGKVDALFIPEWNKDTETFNAIIESAALDVHAYIIQCNDREYGDSRIRAPYKESWMRDIIQVKGGIEDSFLIGEIDIHSLRAFQSSHRSPDKPYKPVPDGFKILHSRETMPRGNED